MQCGEKWDRFVSWLIRDELIKIGNNHRRVEAISLTLAEKMNWGCWACLVDDFGKEPQFTSPAYADTPELHGAWGSTVCRSWQLCQAHGDAIDMTWLSPHKGCWCWQEEDAN